jgi:hypothetical protein
MYVPVKTGIIDYSEKAVPMDQLPPNSTCIETETVTPGSIIGDQISGALKSTGIDKLVNAKELGEILNAVIDAAVNRVAKEGLAYVQSGRGSWTTPQTSGKTYKNRSQNEMEVQGLEGFKASQLLTSLLEFKTNTEKLIRTMGRLGAESQPKINDFNNALSAIPDYANLRTCGGSTTNTQEKIQACFYNMDLGLGGRYGVDLNKELNNPSVFKANQILLERTAALWETIERKLSDLQSNSSKMNSCNKISIILDPGPDQLPVFFPGTLADEEDGIKEESERFYNWSGKNHTYTHYFDNPTNVNVSTIVSGMLSKASSQITSKNLEASTYLGKITSFSEQTASVEEDTNFIDGILNGVTLYANIMMDYDRTGRSITIAGDAEPTSLVAEIQKYNSAMESKDETSVLNARRRLMSAKNITEASWEKSQQDIINNPLETVDTITKAREKILIIRRARSIIDSSRFIPEYVLIDGEDGSERKLISEAIVGETAIINAGEIIPVDGFVVDGTSRANKSRISGEADDIGEISKESRSKVYAGYVNLDSKIKVQITGFMNESLQTGTGPSEAVGKALEQLPETGKPYLPFSLEQIGNELEIRGTRISKQQSDTTSKIGNFLTTPAEMATPGIDGGDTEWEKYYYNRAQFAYAAIINRYIAENWGNCNTTIE